jgi:hypothetical protein
MRLRVEKIGQYHTILDENDVVYGRYDEKADAQASLADWLAYYEEKNNEIRN